MSYISDFTSYSAEVTIDQNEILDYVEENRDWFEEKLGKRTTSQVLIELRNKIQDILDKHNKIRISRDVNKTDNCEVEMYNDLEEVLKIVENNI